MILNLLGARPSSVYRLKHELYIQQRTSFGWELQAGSSSKCAIIDRIDIFTIYILEFSSRTCSLANSGVLGSLSLAAVYTADSSCGES